MIALMQGRLLPPVGGAIQRFPGSRWPEEFSLAAGLGLDAIEWIVDGADENPLRGEPEDLAAVARVADQTGVTVASVCADIFMEDLRLAQGTREGQQEADRSLATLLQYCGILGAVRVVLPFVDASELHDATSLSQAKRAIETALPVAHAEAVELHLETSLAPAEFASFLDEVDDSMVKVNYDMGNSAALGYQPVEEFGAYGHRIGSVHIKDRVRGGSTVPLGTGSTDFPSVFSGLKTLGYQGDFVLQVARGEPNHEVENIRSALDFVGRYLPIASRPST